MKKEQHIVNVLKEQKRNEYSTIIELFLHTDAFALSGRTIDNTTTPRVPLRLPWAMRSLGLQPVLGNKFDN